MLVPVDLQIVRGGPLLDGADQEKLIDKVTKTEIDEAIFSLKDDKAPGLDGFNAFFFKECWSEIKREVYEAVLDP